MFLPHRSPGQDWLNVLITIPEPWVTQLTELRLSLGDLQGSRVPAHITALPPAPFSTGERLEAIRHLREVAGHHSPFRITLKDSDSFRSLSQVVFLSPNKGAAEYADPADGVRTESLDIEQRFPYHPHVTLAQDVDNPVLGFAPDLDASFEVSWLVPGFHLDHIDKNGMYSTMALFGFEASSV